MINKLKILYNFQKQSNWLDLKMEISYFSGAVTVGVLFFYRPCKINLKATSKQTPEII